FDDAMTECPHDGEELVVAPAELSKSQVPAEIAGAAPTERTSMIDLEALEEERRVKKEQLEAERHARRQAREAARVAGRTSTGFEDESAFEDPADDDDRTPAPTGGIARDPDATGTVQRSRFNRRSRT